MASTSDTYSARRDCSALQMWVKKRGIRLSAVVLDLRLSIADVLTPSFVGPTPTPRLARTSHRHDHCALRRTLRLVSLESYPAGAQVPVELGGAASLPDSTNRTSCVKNPNRYSTRTSTGPDRYDSPAA